MSEIDFEQARFNMIEQQVRPWEVLDQRVLDVLAEVPREDFVPVRYRRLAFSDVSIPLGRDQIMMTPKVEGRLLQAIAVSPSDRVLEIGTGSGYLTACLARLAAEVHSVDIFSEFIEAARQKLKTHGIQNTRLHTGDAAHRWGDRSYDVIALTGSLRMRPETWPRQLKLGGRLFVVVGQSPIMEALLITRVNAREWTEESLFDTDLPPLLNAEKPSAFEF